MYIYSYRKATLHFFPKTTAMKNSTVFIIGFLLFSTFPLFAQLRPEVVFQYGHGSMINAFDFSDDERYLASGDMDGIVVIWDVRSGKELRRFEVQEHHINALDFHPGNRFLLSASSDGTVIVWDVFTGDQLANFTAHGEQVLRALFSPDGNLIASGDFQGGIMVWNWGNQAILWRVDQGDDMTQALRFSPQGDYLMVADQTNIYQYAALSGAKIKQWTPGGNIQFSAFSTDTQYFATGNFADLSYFFLTPSATTPTRIFQEDSGQALLYSMNFSKNNPLLATGGFDKSVKIWDLNGKRILQTLSGHQQPVSCVQFSNTGQYLASGSWDNEIKIWLIDSGENFRSFSGKSNLITALAYNPLSDQLAQGGSDHLIHLWDFAHEPAIQTLDIHQSEITALAYHPSGKYLATASRDNLIKIIDPNSGSLQQTLSDHQGQVIDLAYSPNGKYLASAGTDGLVMVWESRTGKKLTNLYGQSEKGVVSVAFSPDGNWLAAGNTEGKVLVWATSHLPDPDNPPRAVEEGLIILQVQAEPVLVFDDLRLNAFITISPDSRYIAAAGENKVVVREIISGRQIQTFTNYFKGLDQIRFGPDGNLYLAGGPGARRVEVYNIYSGQLLQVYPGHGNQIDAILFRAKTNQMITGSWDNSLRFWDLNFGAWQGTLFGSQEGFSMIDRSNYYFTSKSTINNFAFRVDNDALPVEQFHQEFNQPHRVLSTLQLGSPDLIRKYQKAYEKWENTTPDNTADGLDIRLLNSNIPQASYEKRMQFEVAAASTFSPLHHYQVYVNDVPVYGHNGLLISGVDQYNHQRTIELELSNGFNKIQFSVFNREGKASVMRTVEVNYVGPPATSNLYLLCIAVSRFNNQDMNLMYPMNDVEDVQQLFNSQAYQFGEVFSIGYIESMVTRENLASIKDHLRMSTVDDKVIVFIAGHGLLDEELNYYLATYDTDFQHPKQNAIPFEALEAILDAIPARRKLMLIDACHSGEIDKEGKQNPPPKQIDDGTVTFRGFPRGSSPKRTGSDNSFELMKNLFVDLRRSTGTTVISSASGGEPAIEGDEWQNGVFTYCFLKGLQDRKADLNYDGKIMVSELRSYLAEAVTELTNGLQQPTFRLENISNDWQVW